MEHKFKGEKYKAYIYNKKNYQHHDISLSLNESTPFYQEQNQRWARQWPQLQQPPQAVGKIKPITQFSSHFGL